MLKLLGEANKPNHFIKMNPSASQISPGAPNSTMNAAFPRSAAVLLSSAEALFRLIDTFRFPPRALLATAELILF